jgi:hypothetical protein
MASVCVYFSLALSLDKYKLVACYWLRAEDCAVEQASVLTLQNKAQTVHHPLQQKHLYIFSTQYLSAVRFFK